MKEKIDMSAIYHLAVMDDHWLNTFRFSITLQNKINPVFLQQCVDQLVPKYPMLCCKITHDLFNYYIEEVDTITVQKDQHPILRSVTKHTIEQYALTILYHENTLSLEAFHAITDGHGALTFLKDLLALYTSTPICLQNNLSQAYEDSYIANTQSSSSKQKYSFPKFNGFRFHHRSHLKPIQITTIELDLNETKSLTKQLECGINEFITTIFYRSILQAHNTKNKEVSIQIPVNLRNHFPSTSLRNFTLCLLTSLDAQSKQLSLKDMIQHIHNQIKERNTPIHFLQEIHKIVKAQKNPMVTHIPLPLKIALIRYYYVLCRERSCMTITNLGRIQFDNAELNNQIQHMDVMLSPRYHTPYNCGIISCKDKIRINITHDDHLQLIHELKKHFIELGLSIKCQAYQPE